jgi:hypothetical protein
MLSIADYTEILSIKDKIKKNFLYNIVVGARCRLYGPVIRFQATDPEVRVRFTALPDFLGSSGFGTWSSQPLEDNWGAT